MKKILLPLIILLAFTSCQKSLDSNTTLWFERPAANWNEATPLGNGRIGAMDFGQTDYQRIQLNEESLWAGAPQEELPENAAVHIQQFRELLLAKKYKEAYDYGIETLTFRPTSFRSYQSLGDLIVSYQQSESATEYERILDLEEGLLTTRYKTGDNQITRKMAITAKADLLILEITSKKRGILDLTVNLKRDQDASVYFTDEESILMDGQIIDIPAPEAYDDNPGGSGPGGKHMRFAARVSVDQEDGKATASPDGIRIEGASRVEIRLTAATNFDVNQLNFTDELKPLDITKRILERAEKKNAAELFGEHQREHKALFSQVSLDLGPTPNPGLSTYERMLRAVEGGQDPLLDAQYYQFGRYLLMSSSRYPGKLPANLQGIWNESYWAPWEADYHQNINLQMNYWPALSGNLEECIPALDNFLIPVYERGKRTAAALYGSDGWVAHTATSLFGRTTPSGSTLSSQMINGYGFPLAGAWMSLYMFRYFEYTQDTAYLRNIAYPTMKGAAEFIRDYLVKRHDGFLVSVPSSSPENNFIDPKTGESQRLTFGSTMDNQIIREVLGAVIESSRILDSDKNYRLALTAILPQIAPTRIGENGTIMEWIEDYEETEPGHRHMSHLFALHPTYQISPDQTPKLAEAARKTIERRLENGGGHTGWSRAWLINFYARLWDGEEAYKHLQLLFQKSTKPNLFDNHPPFQIDGNFGGAAAVSEMLLQSRPDQLILLPALPAAWPNGTISGLKARGNIEVNLEWENNTLKTATLISPYKQQILVTYGSETKQLTLKPNKKMKW